MILKLTYACYEYYEMSFPGKFVMGKSIDKIFELSR